MGSNRYLRKNSRRRPVKKAREKRRRLKTQKQRLVALGMDEATVAKLNRREVRELLKRPKKIATSN